MRRDPEGALRVMAIGTLVVGAALAALPGPIARLLGAGRHVAGVRAMGVADLALVPGLLAGRPRWVWAVVRTGLTLVFAGATGCSAVQDRSPRTTVATAGLLALAVQDAIVVSWLRAADAA
ncbi:MAG: hypothetical protein M3Y91_05615 [Actinomycetota bacterium]|nr:hypothetical protein [Actinomycetota bacterium]